MGRCFVLKVGGECYNVQPEKISRDDLYNRRVKRAVDRDGNACGTAMVCQDGTTIIHSYTSQYVDNSGEYVSRGDLKKVDEEGNLVPATKSMFDDPKELTPVSPDYLTRFLVSGTHVLTVENDAKLAATSPGVFDYVYSNGATPQKGVVLEGVDGTQFMLVGSSVEPQSLRFDTLIPDCDGDLEEEDEDISFGDL